MKKIPDIIFIIDIKKEAIAVTEAHRLGIPIVAVVDTNCDPTGITYPIPGNDDAIRAIKLISSIMADAVSEGRANQIEAGGGEESDEPEEYVMDADAERIMEDYLIEEEAKMRHAKIRRKITGTEENPSVEVASALPGAKIEPESAVVKKEEVEV
jgi:small subunit ribosomal protein S2